MLRDLNRGPNLLNAAKTAGLTLYRRAAYNRAKREAKSRIQLVKQRPPDRIGIIIKPNEPRAKTLAARIADWASATGVAVLVDDRVAGSLAKELCAPSAEIAEKSDVLVVLGGDGTMIGAARLVAGRDTPVLGVNLGSLGYLTEFAVEETIPALELLTKGDYEVESRVMLDWTVIRGATTAGEGSAVNDVVVNNGTLARVFEIDCSIGDNYVTTYRGDGLIVATPTGSTAYNLSAGGPIIHPNTKAIAIAPICPHTLTNRPIVLPDSSEITLEPKPHNQEVRLTADGQAGLPLAAGDRVLIKKSSRTFNIIRPPSKEYFQILRDKLKWSGR